MEPKPIKDGVQVYELASWKDMLDVVLGPLSTAPAYIFRGQADKDWPVVSTLSRLQRKHPFRKNMSGNNPEFFRSPPLTEEEQLAAFRRAIRGRCSPNAPPLDDDDECWALGQHHGLATPLIDWTRSPFMALFFAFEEERVTSKDSLVAPTGRTVFALSTSVFEDTGDGSSSELRFISPSSDSNFRLVSQQGMLVRLPVGTDLEKHVREAFSGQTRQAVLKKFHIPNEGRDACLVMLNKMGINHMTLFPDISGAARHVNSLWQPGHEDLIAWV